MAGAKACWGARRAAVAGRGGEGEAAAVDANHQGRDGDATNWEMIRSSTAKEKEKEWVRVTSDVDTVLAMAVAATEGRRKRGHRRASSSSLEDNEEEEGERRSPSSCAKDDGDSEGG